MPLRGVLTVNPERFLPTRSFLLHVAFRLVAGRHLGLPLYTIIVEQLLRNVQSQGARTSLSLTGTVKPEPAEARP